MMADGWYGGVVYRDFGSYYEAHYFQPRAFITLIITLTWLGYANQWAMITFEEEFVYDDGEDDTSGELYGNLRIHRPGDVRGTDAVASSSFGFSI